MASASFTLTNPQDYDLQQLIQVTRESLALLKPWTVVKPSSDPPKTEQDTLVKGIALQASKYVAAIQMGVAAAYSGFTVTEEVLFLADLDTVEEEEDILQYLKGMNELANQARENANKAFEAFRNVRTDIYATVTKLNPEALDKNYKPAQRKFPNLPLFKHADIETLAKFADQISAYANWWDRMKIETHPPFRSGQPVEEYLAVFKDPTLIRRWKNLRAQYAAYVQMITEMEDADPHFFTGSWRAQTPNSTLSSAPSPSRQLLPAAPTLVEQSERVVGPSPSAPSSPTPSHPESVKPNDKPSPESPKPNNKRHIKDLSSQFVDYFSKAFPRVMGRLKLGSRVRKVFRRTTLDQNNNTKTTDPSPSKPSPVPNQTRNTPKTSVK
ncbi:hypothetical protein D9613_002301 [Agrocybe pediades]|uniref:Uncharacterized protein n=1 Tax=Agrocybe pediades TaxID=84607 RepID=A0A8H4R6K2_9AGAR|nr:hypothetical protein D9613_002301 [Agrocybe pediades]